MKDKIFLTLSLNKSTLYCKESCGLAAEPVQAPAHLCHPWRRKLNVLQAEILSQFCAETQI